jgi:flavin reductase (DIM6/NTAB) family NADH-FMN oxidoreductase RutF
MSQAMAELFKRITSGVYVVGVGAGERHNAFTAAWVMPVSFKPPMLAVSVNPQHTSYAQLKEEGVFSVNVPRRDRLDWVGHFAAPSTVDKLASVTWRVGKTGAPLLEDALARFECELAGNCPAGDHVLVLGRVVDGALLQPEAEPLTYRDAWDISEAADLFPDSFA